MTEDALLRCLLEGTADDTGADFFAALVRSAAKALNVAGAWVTEYIPNERALHALAFWFEDRFIADYRYPIDGSPCEHVIERACLIHYPDRLIELFPADPELCGLNAVSYIGVPLLDADGAILGHLAVLDKRTLELTPWIESVFRIFAIRAAAELRRCRAESVMRDSEERFSNLVNSAMDAVLELDARFLIERVNSSASSLFGVPAEAMHGRDFQAYLTPDSAEKLRSLAAALHSGERQYQWVPRGFEALLPDGAMFPAEASISRFTVRGGSRYGVILRSIQDQLAAERRIHELESQSAYLQDELAHWQGTELIGRSRSFRKVLSAVRHVAATPATVLITGETGTGKELIARAIHSGSSRAAKPLVKVNCAAIPAALMESEFFGHERGAFTGASQRRVGRFELAHGGAIFLDEIGELSPELQPKLLRVLQDGEFEPVGSSQTRKVDVRVIAATNRDLLAEVKTGRFREDLYYRLHVFPIHTPPLRERDEDIALLASAFIDKACRQLGKPLLAVTPDGLRRLRCYDWPGNVRELQNVIERAVILSRDNSVAIDQVLTAETLANARASRKAVDKAGPRTKRDLLAIERANLIEALERTGWKVAGEAGAALLLGLPPSTLNSRMKALGIRRPNSDSR